MHLSEAGITPAFVYRRKNSLNRDVIISFEDFGFQYTAQAEPTLYNIDPKVHKGEKILIEGPSGCGKSTLAHYIVLFPILIPERPPES